MLLEALQNVEILPADTNCVPSLFKWNEYKLDNYKPNTSEDLLKNFERIRWTPESSIIANISKGGIFEGSYKPATDVAVG